MALNPAAFVTPYTSVGTSRIGSGASMANTMNQMRQQKQSEKYQNEMIGLQTRQANTNDQRYAAKEIDEANQALLSAIASGDPDHVEAAANNLRSVGSRHGYTIDEQRSDTATAGLAGTKTEASQSLKTLDQEGLSPEAPAAAPEDTTAQQEDFFRGKAQGKPPARGMRPPPTAVPMAAPEAESNARIDAELAADQPSPFTGMRPPGGALPVEPPKASAAEPPGTSEAPLRGYTIRGPDGKPLYSMSPKDVVLSQRKRVGDVFNGLREQLGSQADAGALDESQRIAEGLIGVLTPQQAVMKGLEHFETGQGARARLETVFANKSAKNGGASVGGGVPASGGYALGAGGKADATLNDDVDKVRTMFVNSDQYKNVVQKRLLVEGAQSQLQSDNGMSQQEAVSTLRRIQSGLTLNAFETQEFNNAAGAIEGVYNKFNKLFGGGQLSPEYKRQLLEVYQRINGTLDAHTQRLAQDAYEYFVSTRSRAASPDVVKEKGGALKKSLGGKEAPAPTKGVSEDDF